MSNDAILLLGGSGFIGTVLAKRLTAAGRRVHIIARHAPPACFQGSTFHAGNLDEENLLERLLPECDTVIHLASCTTPGRSAGKPGLEMENLVPTLHLLEIMDRYPARLVYLSSGGAVYGNPLSNPVHEDSPLAPLSYYGAGKAATEGFLHAYSGTGKRLTILRPSNAYGPGQGLHNGFGLIRTILDRIVCGTELEIWGDGNNVRDFIYIDDLVEAIIGVLNNSSVNGIFNVGSGRGHSLRQVAAIAERVCGMPLRLQYKPARGIDVREIVLDISHIQQTLGWQPRINLEEGLRRTWQWIVQQ